MTPQGSEVGIATIIDEPHIVEYKWHAFQSRMTGTRSMVVAGELAMRCPICLDSVVQPVVTECGHRFCRKCIHCALRQFKRECPVCRRFIASHRVLKPWVEDGHKEKVSTIVIEDVWICSTCTLQNSVSEVRCTACLGRRATNRGRPLLSPGKACADGASTASGVTENGARVRNRGGKAARVAQPAVKESPLATGISGACEGVCGEQGCVGAASAVLAQGVDGGEDMVDCTVVVELAAMIPAEGHTSTGYRGVHRTRNQTNPFQARIWENGRSVVLGRFRTVEEASRVYTAHLAKKMEARRVAASPVAPPIERSAAEAAATAEGLQLIPSGKSETGYRCVSQPSPDGSHLPSQAHSSCGSQVCVQNEQGGAPICG